MPAEAKLTREQVRAKNKETLLEVINNNSISEDQKQYAVDSMNAMVDAAEREASAELLLVQRLSGCGGEHFRRNGGCGHQPGGDQ